MVTYPIEEATPVTHQTIPKRVNARYLSEMALA
jgi:hypothetical protein